MYVHRVGTGKNRRRSTYITYHTNYSTQSAGSSLPSLATRKRKKPFPASHPPLAASIASPYCYRSIFVQSTPSTTPLHPTHLAHMAAIHSSTNEQLHHTQDVVASSSLNNNLHLQHRPSSSQRQDGPSAPPPLTIGIGGGTSTARPTSSVNSISSRSISSPVNTIPDRGMGDSQQWKNVRTLPSWLPSRCKIVF